MLKINDVFKKRTVRNVLRKKRKETFSTYIWLTY